MTYQEARGGMQLIAELVIGKQVRQAQRQQDQKFASSVASVKADQ